MTDVPDVFGALERHDLAGLADALSAGADPNVRKPSPPFWSALHEAIEHLEDGGTSEAVILLLRHGADVEGGAGDSPLLMSLYRNHPDVTRLLLAAGADPNRRGDEGDSALRICADRGDLATAATLLRCGASTTVDDAGGPVGASALGIAVARLDAAMAALLVSEGASTIATDLDRRTPGQRLPARTATNARAYDLVLAVLSAGVQFRGGTP